MREAHFSQNILIFYAAKPRDHRTREGSILLEDTSKGTPVEFFRNRKEPKQAVPSEKEAPVQIALYQRRGVDSLWVD
jgi:hypothetical protein